MPTGMDSATAAHTVKAALVAVAEDILPAGTLVTFGHPGPQIKNYQDAVAFTTVQVGQRPATLSTNRSRDETVTVTCVVSCFRPGGADQEAVASAAAYSLLRTLDYQLRHTDPELGGLVRHCFLVSHVSDGETREELIVNGRTIEIEATFEAVVRITG